VALVIWTPPKLSGKKNNSFSNEEQQRFQAHTSHS
jgi:hypothetical protein